MIIASRFVTAAAGSFRASFVWLVCVALLSTFAAACAADRDGVHSPARTEMKKKRRAGAAGAKAGADAASEELDASSVDAAVDREPDASGDGEGPKGGTGGGEAPAAGAGGVSGAGGSPGSDGSSGAGGSAGMGGSSGAGGSESPEPDAGKPDAGVCTRPIELSSGHVVPTVWLVIDGSGSMADPLVPHADPTQPLVEPTRWESLRSTLLDPASGLVPALSPLMRFGLVIFDGPLGGFPGTATTLPDGGPATGVPPTDECPRLSTIEPALNNAGEIERAFPLLAPGGSTPTHKALAHVSSRLPATATSNDASPTYILLATDGAPNDFCGGAQGDPFGMNPDPVQVAVVEHTQSIVMQGAPVYVISLAASDQRLTNHLTTVAAAGGTNTQPFTPETKDRLVETFRQLVGPELLCAFKLPDGPGLSTTEACRGSVQLNGQPLECDSDNGWRIRDSSTIEITGEACAAFKRDPSARVTASFPCASQLEP